MMGNEGNGLLRSMDVMETIVFESFASVWI